MQCRLSRHKMNKHMKYEIYWNIYTYKIYLYWRFIEKLAEHCEQFSFHCIKVCIKHTAQRQTKSAETNSIDVISLVFPDWWPRPCCLIELYIHYWLIWSSAVWWLPLSDWLLWLGLISPLFALKATVSHCPSAVMDPPPPPHWLHSISLFFTEINTDEPCRGQVGV